MSDINNDKQASDKLVYIAPKIESEEILQATLGSTCNGMAGGGRKADTAGGCSTLKT